MATDRLQIIVEGQVGPAVDALREVERAEERLARTTATVDQTHRMYAARLDSVATASSKGASSALDLAESHQQAARAAAQAGGALAGLNARMASLEQAKQHAAALTSEVNGLANSMLKIGAGGAAGIGAAVKVYSDLESTLAAIQGRTGATVDVMGQLQDKAVELGLDTRLAQYGAKDMADSMLVLAEAGYAPTEMMGGMVEASGLLAASLSTDLASATQLAADMARTFDTEASKMPGLADQIVASSIAGGTSASMMAETLKMVGPVASSLNKPVDEMLGTIAALSQNMLRGSMAGTGLSNMLQALVPTTEAAAKAMTHYFGSTAAFVDAQGRMKSMTEVAGLLEAKLGRLSEAERMAAMGAIFGQQAMKPALALMKEGAVGLQSYIDRTNETGKASELARLQNETLAGSWAAVAGSIETVGLKLGAMLAPTISQTLMSTAKLIESLSNADAAMGGLLSKAAVGSTVIVGFGGVVLKARIAVMTYSVAKKILTAETHKNIAADVGNTVSKTGNTVSTEKNTRVALVNAAGITRQSTAKNAATSAMAANTTATAANTTVTAANSAALAANAASGLSAAKSAADLSTKTAAASGASRGFMGVLTSLNPVALTVKATLAGLALGYLWIKPAIDDAREAQERFNRAVGDAANAGYLNESGMRKASILANAPSTWDRVKAYFERIPALTPGSGAQPTPITDRIREYDRVAKEGILASDMQKPSAAGKMSIADQMREEQAAANQPASSGGGAFNGLPDLSGKSGKDSAAADAQRKTDEENRKSQAWLDYRIAVGAKLKAELAALGPGSGDGARFAEAARRALTSGSAVSTPGYCAGFVSDAAQMAGLSGRWNRANATPMINDLERRGYRVDGPPQPGDILAWRRAPVNGKEASHVAVAIGDGMVAENTSSTSRGQRMQGGKRLVPLDQMPKGYQLYRPFEGGGRAELEAKIAANDAEILRTQRVMAERSGNLSTVTLQQEAEQLAASREARRQQAQDRMAGLDALLRSPQLIGERGLDRAALQAERDQLALSMAETPGSLLAAEVDIYERQRQEAEDADRAARDEELKAAQVRLALAEHESELTREQVEIAKFRRESAITTASEWDKIERRQQEVWSAELALAELRGESATVALRIEREGLALERERLESERAAERERLAAALREREERAQGMALWARQAKLMGASKRELDRIQGMADASVQAVAAEKARQGDRLGAQEMLTGLAEDMAGRKKNRDGGILDAIIGGDSGRVQDILQAGRRWAGTAPSFTAGDDSLDAQLRKMSQPDIERFIPRLIQSLQQRDDALLDVIVKALQRA